jgi:Putative lumazine-binding
MQAKSLTSGPESADHASVRACVQTYFDSHALNSATHIHQAFLPSAHVEGNRQGVFTSWPLAEYCVSFKGSPAIDEASRVRRIEWIDVVGDAAAAKATLVHGDITFTDFFVLLKVTGDWKIANKVYSTQRA